MTDDIDDIREAILDAMYQTLQIAIDNGDHAIIDKCYQMYNDMSQKDMSVGKLNRWLGFAQGVLWHAGEDLDAFKDINRDIPNLQEEA